MKKLYFVVRKDSSSIFLILCIYKTIWVWNSNFESRDILFPCRGLDDSWYSCSYVKPNISLDPKSKEIVKISQMDEAFLSKKYNLFNTVYIVYDLSYRTIWEVGGLSDHMRIFVFSIQIITGRFSHHPCVVVYVNFSSLKLRCDNFDCYEENPMPQPRCAKLMHKNYQII